MKENQMASDADNNGRAFVSPQPGESSKAFHAFGHYRDLPADMRSIAAAYQEHLEQCGGHKNSGKTAARFWEQWSSKHGWVDRVKGHDADLSLQQRERFARELSEAKDNAAKTAKAAIALLIYRLRDLDVNDIPVTALAGWFKTFVEVQLRALGDSDKLDHKVEIEPITVTYVLPDGKRMEDYKVPAGDPDACPR